MKREAVERFKVFSEHLDDQELSKFYKDLMVSEANHYTLFLGYARTYMDRTVVDQKWQDLLAFEANMMKKRGTLAKGTRLMFNREESAKIRQEFWTSFGKSFPRKWLLYNTKIKRTFF